MIQVCMDCKIKYGEKPPYDNKSKTHGICKKCLAVRMKEIKKRKEK